MADNVFRPIMIAILITGLFAIAIGMGGYMLAVQNNAQQNILNDSKYASLIGNLTSNIQSYEATTKSASTSFENSTVSTTSSLPFIDSIYGTWKVIKSAPVTMYTLITEVIFKTLLGSQTATIVTSVLAIILMITIIFAIVKLVSTGEGG